MARVTVEDSVKVIESRFELILIAAESSRILSKGAEPLLDRDRDKNPVVALREIAENKLDLEQTKEILVNLRTYRGLRLRNKLPVRGQRTHTNAKTSKRIY